MSVIGKEKIRSSRTQAAGTLFYTKRSRVSRIRVITDSGTDDEKRTGEVPTLDYTLLFTNRRVKPENWLKPLMNMVSKR